MLIDANRDYYPLDRIPVFWDWLLQECVLRNVKVPNEIYREVVNPGTRKGDDLLVDWMRIHTKQIVLDETLRRWQVDRVIREGYISDPTDGDLERIGNDASLIAYALENSANRTIVTTERSRPSRQGSNRHVPDVCDILGVKCMHTFKFIRELEFRTQRGP